MTTAIVERAENVKHQLAVETVEYLNELLAIDPDGIDSAFSVATDCDPDLGEHPTLQVWAIQSAQPEYAVGVLGIINGLIGVRDGVGYITAVYDDDSGRLIRFDVTTEEQRAKMKPLKMSHAH